MFACKKIAAIGALLACTMHTYAAPVLFTFTGTIVVSDIPGVNEGNSINVTLLADNGNSGTLSQQWGIADLISGSLTAGTYSQTYIDGWFQNPDGAVVKFSTDALGNLTTSDFFGTTSSPNHQDSFGTGSPVYLFSNGMRDFFSRVAGFTPFSSNLSTWTITELDAAEPTETPEPATLGLLGLGLAAAGLAKRRARS